MKLSVAIPVYNEEKTLPPLLAELRKTLSALDCDFEIVFIDDGSRDGTPALLDQFAAADARIKVLRFSRNFGHQLAVTAGLDFATGDAVLIMDADLQDPPQLIPELLRLYRDGYDVVSPQRIRREGDTWIKRRSAALFYSTIRWLSETPIPPEVGDFRLLSRAAVDAVQSLREQHRFMRGLIAWLGLREIFVPFERRPRAAGETKYSMWKMLRLSWTAVTSFSALPLRIATLGGVFASLTAAGYTIYAGYRALIEGAVVPGWTSIVFLQCFFFGITLLAIGMIGQYIARIYDESKQRPLYVVAAMRNVEAETPARAIVIPPRA